MNGKRYLLAIAAIFMASILFFSCDSGDGGDPGGIDFTSNNTNYSILVKNNTSQRLIAFKGVLSAGNIIGGIPANATNHGLPYNASLFHSSEDFALILLTEAQYNANKSNLQSQNNTPFTRVNVFYKKNGDNSYVYEIASALGGNNTFTVINASNNINVELRLAGAAGETIGYFPAGILETTLKLQDGNYNIFPVFKRYNAFRDVVETVYPQGTGSGYAWFQPYSFGEGTTIATMDLKNLLQSTTFILAAAWIYVDNQTTGSGIRFVEGTDVKTTVSGLSNIMSGTPRTFQIDMPKTGNNYATSRTVSDWKFGPAGSEVALQTSSSDSTPKGTFTINENTMYTITVTNTGGTLKAYISDTTAIPATDLAGRWN